MLQRRFVDSSGNLHFFDKRRPASGVRKTGPNNLFLETDLYSLVDEAGNKDATPEVAVFAKLDNIGNKLIEKIVSSVRSGRNPGLTSQEKIAWDTFLYFQWKRVPDEFSQNATLLDFDQKLDSIIAQLETEPPRQPRRPFGFSYAAIARPSSLA